MISGINHITIAVKSLSESLAFYQNVLGFKLIMRSSQTIYLLAGDLWFCLALDDHTRSQPLPEYTYIAFSVAQSDFSTLSEKIRNSGAVAWKENISEGDSYYFLDPNGHKLEIHVGDWKTRLAAIKADPWEPGIEIFED